MNKAYVIATLAAVMGFGGIYWSYSSRREAFIRQRDEQAAIAFRDQQERAKRDQAAAADAATPLEQDQLEHDQREAAQKQVRVEAEQHPGRTFEQERKFGTQLDRRRA